MAIRFNGTVSATLITRSANLPANNSFTLMCWVRILVLTTGGADLNTIYRLGPNTAGGMYDFCESGGVIKIYDGSHHAGSASMSIGVWRHVAFTGLNNAGNTELRAYVNGALDATSVTLTAAGITVGEITIGDSRTNDPLSADVAACKMYNVAKSAADIQQEMWSYVPQQFANLIGWFPMRSLDEALIDRALLGDFTNVGSGADPGSPTYIDGPPISWGAPRRRRVYITGATFNTFTHTMTGGLQSGGAGVAALKKAIVAAGGLQSGGHAPASIKKVVIGAGGLQSGGAGVSSLKKAVVMIGGLTSAGAAVLAVRRAVAMLGGLQSGGHAANALNKAIVMSGGLLTGGTGGARAIKSFVMSGGVQSGGHAPASMHYRFQPSGGLNAGGAATVVFTGVVTYPYTMSGGLQSGGAAPSSSRRSFVPSGGLQSGGHAPSAQRRAVTMLGGVVAGGSAAQSRRIVYVPSGGLQSGGAATTTFVFGGAVPAAFLGRVWIFPALDGRTTVSAAISGIPLVTPG